MRFQPRGTQTQTSPSAPSRNAVSTEGDPNPFHTPKPTPHAHSVRDFNQGGHKHTDIPRYTMALECKFMILQPHLLPCYCSPSLKPSLNHFNVNLIGGCALSCAPSSLESTAPQPVAPRQKTHPKCATPSLESVPCIPSHEVGHHWYSAMIGHKFNRLQVYFTQLSTDDPRNHTATL